MKRKLILCAVTLLLVFLFSACAEEKEVLPSFSYEQVLKDCEGVYEGVERTWFENTDIVFVMNGQEAVTRSKIEVDIEYDTIDVAFDLEKEMYQVTYRMADDPEAPIEHVYLNTFGITKLIVYENDDYIYGAEENE